MEVKVNIIPVLIGADMNCYSVARAFHELDNKHISYAFGRWQMGETMYSDIIKFKQVEDIDNKDTLIKVITDFANSKKDSKLIVIGCTDDYASLLIEVKDDLPQNCIAPYIDVLLRDKLVNKDDFYKMCDEYGLLYPKTVNITQKTDAQELTEEKLGFKYPVIIKPSSSIRYWKFPFDGMKKVYVSYSAQESEKILRNIFNSGYDDIMLVQDMIPGDDSYMRVLTAYCDKNHNVRMMCMGHVGLEEHTPKAIGNHAAIITEYNEQVMTSIKEFLQKIKYTGYANFDIKYDTRDGTYRIFEINLRQGRSNYYVTGAGFNIARYILADRFYDKHINACDICKTEHYWHSVPNGVVFKYVKNKEFVEKAKQLIKQKNESITLKYNYDLKLNPKRFAYYVIHMHRYFKKFKKYCK